MTLPVPDKTDYVSLTKLLRDLARTAAVMPPADPEQFEALRDAARGLYLALEANAPRTSAVDEIAAMTPDEEVRLLHIME